MTVATVREATQYLTLTLDPEVFALEIAKVRKVLAFTAGPGANTKPRVDHGARAQG